jgi:predicted nucleotidyltransferase
VTDPFDVVDPRYRELFARLQATLEGDHRVTAVEATGSIEAGTADRWSDLDVGIVATADGYDDFLAEWPRWLAEVTPTVFARTPIVPFVINTVTADGLTLDIAVYKGERYVFPPTTGYQVGLLSSTRFDDIGAALEYAVAEQLRGMAGPFISLVKRDEHLRHLTGLAHLLGLLTTVFLAELDGPPLGKQWNDVLTEEQRAAVAALPPAGATRDGVVDFGLGVAELVITRARPLFARYGLEWPAPLAAVVAARVRDELGVDLSAWLY